MNKNDIVELLKKEMREMNTLLQNMEDAQRVPPVLFQLSYSKIENLKNLLVLFQKEMETCQTQVDVQPEKAAENIVVENPQPVEVEEVEIENPIENQQKTIEVQPLEPKEENFVEEKQQIISNATEKKSLNDKMSKNNAGTFESAIANKKIQNLRQAINVVDKFRYQKELFGGNVDLMNTTLDRLNNAQSWDEACGIMQQSGWNDSEPVVEEFKELVKRKFN